MKRRGLFSCILCLVLGLLIGLLLPAPWDQDPAVAPPVTPEVIKPVIPEVSSPAAADQDTAFDPEDNMILLKAACSAAEAIKAKDFSLLSSMVSDDNGVTFTPYSSVDPETVITLTAQQIKKAPEDQNIYGWGFEDGRGNLIEMTISEYFAQYVFDADYTKAPQVGIDTVLISGNALENVREAYPDCRFVDFSYPSSDPVNDGLDWCSLKLVFKPEQSAWKLVGVIHGQWTI